jgi:putative flippase GtrA
MRDTWKKHIPKWLLTKICFKIFWKDFLKFTVVGITSTILNYGVFYIFLQFLHIGYLAASWTGYVVWFILGYFLNKSWTFEQKGKHNVNKIIQYTLVYTFSLFSWLWILYILVHIFSFDPKICNILIIWYTTMTNFIWTKYLVFHKKTDDRF